MVTVASHTHPPPPPPPPPGEAAPPAAGPTAVFLICPMMCQLLGMNCNTPTDFCFSFTGFAERAGVTDVHADGFGIAFYEDRGVRCFLDVLPASRSPIANLVKTYPIKTLNMVAHIRLATYGEVLLRNVHPFCRELWGRHWTFAHNGDLGPTTLARLRQSTWAPYRPVGETDSEAAFCFILNQLAAQFPGPEPPAPPAVYDALRALFHALAAEDGCILNFLLCDSDHLFVGCWPGTRPGSAVYNGLHYLVRQDPFRRAHLSDCDYNVDFSQEANPNDRVSVIATQPLTVDEEWTEMRRGDLFLFHHGRPLRSLAEVERALSPSGQCEVPAVR
eukprot:EG_transcript_17247